MANFSANPDPRSGPHPGPHLDSPDDIRLIRLMPGADDDHIFCELIRTNLDAAPLYEALLYTWGDPLDVATVSIKIPATEYTG